MTQYELFNARIIWSYLLDLDDARLLNWQAWAEETILNIDFTAPFWLCELTAAQSVQAALDCVREGIGMDYGDFATDEIDEESLLFGLLYVRFARQEQSAYEAWRIMADFGDLAEYVDSGNWRQYQQNRGVNTSVMSPEASTSAIFRPVAAYALRTTRKTLKKSEHVRRFMRRLREAGSRRAQQKMTAVAARPTSTK